MGREMGADSMRYSGAARTRNGGARSVLAPRCALVVAACWAFLCVATGEAYCQKAVPRQGYTSPGEPPGVLLDRANVLVMQGRFDDAIPILENLAAKFPRLSAAKEMISECYLKAGRAQDAVTFLERCLEEEPDNFVYVRNLGLAYIDRGQKERAVAIWRGILKDDERSAGLYGTIAKMEQDAGLYDEAIETLRAGKKFKHLGEHYAREIIRLERILGRDEEAIREALLLVGRREGGLESELGTVGDIFRESEKKERLVAIVDSVVTRGGDRSGIFRTLKTIFLIEDGRYDEARKALFGPGAQPPREEELYSLLIRMEQLSHGRNGERFDLLYGEMMEQFLARYGSSMPAPRVLLMMASGKRDAARNAGAGREKLLEEVLALADSAKRHRAAGAYLERAAIFKARVLFDDFRRPDEALGELDGVRWRSDDGMMTEAAKLRVRILLASSNGEEAARELARLAADSRLAPLGRYGIGRLNFLTGKYGEAVKVLSELAEKHPSSEWANDALELAMDVKGATPEGTGALDLYRAAILATERGNYVAAIDSLAALETRHPSSSLAPRAIFMKAELEAALGGSDAAPGASGAELDSPGAPPPAAAEGGVSASAMLEAARADFTRLAERFSLHDLAPRALEKLAGLAERRNPGEAIKQYGMLMERYPDYPFMERVRERYIALGKSSEPATEKKGTNEPAEQKRRTGEPAEHKKGSK